jgi:hypothetical protein
MNFTHFSASIEVSRMRVNQPDHLPYLDSVIQRPLTGATHDSPELAELGQSLPSSICRIH